MKIKTLYILIFIVFIGNSTQIYAQFGGGGKGLYYRDADGDGLGDPNISTTLIPLDNSYVDNGDDCDDTDANIGAGSLWFIDSDGDGFGETTNFQSACTQPAGYVNNHLDQCPSQYGTNNGCPGQTGPSNDQNYIHTINYQKAFNIGQETAATVQDQDKIETITYFDGLGRPIQNIAIRAGGNNQDIVTHIEYDNYGRQAKEFLPFATLTNEGSYRTGASASTYNYNNTKYATSHPYSEKYFEASPLNRILEQTAPGESWKKGATVDANGHSNGHSIKFGYKTNTSTTEVRLYSISLSSDYTPILQNTTPYYFGIGQLYKTIAKDENWKTSDGLNKTTEEFKDKQGRVVLKRTYNNGQKHDTYYVYDDYGNLTYVLPPKAEATISLPTATKLAELCYQYQYDKRNRLIKKKIPGKGWEYIVYDNLDRPVLTQDANQRAKSPDEWLFTKYDALGRVVYTGIYTSNSSQTTLQTIFTNKTPTQNYETKTTNSGYGGTYYTNSDFPTSGIEILTVNYYDNYTFNRAGAGSSASAYTTTSTSKIKGLATGSRVKVLGTNSWITTVTYYDNKARPFYTYSKNDYLSTTDIVKSKLDYFTGRILETTTLHTKSGQATITMVDALDYDAMNRIKEQTQKINTKPIELIAKNTYDELGQLVHKGVGNVASDVTNRLQEIDYSYNIRGWLTKINDVNNLGTNLFAFAIDYDGATNPLYNGNISKTQWRTANTDSSLKTYSYSYDNLNRITGAIDNTNNYSLSNVIYDKNGNIKTLDRKGHINAGASLFGNMDLLKYYYQPNSNKLIKVLDTSGKIQGFKDGANIATEYTYDQNGNLISDANKGIISIVYNHLNLPTFVEIAGVGEDGNITYVYDATGVKVRKIAIDENTQSSITTDYAGNFIYENNVLKQFFHSEGYVKPSGTNFKYVYQYKDHQNSIRISYSDADGNGSISQNEILQERNMYPFGLEHKGYNNNIREENNHKTYQGQELTKDLGLNIHEWKYRFSDPTIGRFWQIDPLAEDYVHNGVYNFSENRVIDAWELEGLEALLVAEAMENQASKGASDTKKTEKPKAIGTEFTSVIDKRNLVKTGYPGESLDLAVTMGIQWLGSKLTGSNVSKQTSERFQLGTSLLIFVISKGKNGKAGAELTEQLLKKNADDIAEGITDINKAFSNGSQLNEGGLESVINSSSYYDDIAEKGTSVFNSIVKGHIFTNGNKRTASKFITQFAKDNKLNINLNAEQLKDLTSEIANGAKISVEDLAKRLFGNGN